ncbi:MAG: hypothetical protein ABIF17_04350 [Patescibacteria group bacterium]
MPNKQITKRSYAEDYLLQYKVKKEIPNWLSLLIQKTIHANGNIFYKDKEEVFLEFLKENKIDSEEKITISNSNNNDPCEEKKDRVVQTGKHLSIAKHHSHKRC